MWLAGLGGAGEGEWLTIVEMRRQACVTVVPLLLTPTSPHPYTVPTTVAGYARLAGHEHAKGQGPGCG